MDPPISLCTAARPPRFSVSRVSGAAAGARVAAGRAHAQHIQGPQGTGQRIGDGHGQRPDAGQPVRHGPIMRIANKAAVVGPQHVEPAGKQILCSQKAFDPDAAVIVPREG